MTQVSKLFPAFRLLGASFILAVVVLNVAFLGLRICIDRIPLSDYLEYRRILLTLLSIGYVGFFPAAIFLIANPFAKLGLIVLAVPLCWLVSIDICCLPERVLQTAEVGDKRYYLTGAGSFGDPWVVIMYYQCEPAGLDCQRKWVNNTANFDQAGLLYDEETGELYAMHHGTAVVQYDRSVPPRYEVISHQIFNGQNYWFGKDITPESGEFFLFRCTREVAVACQKLRIDYSPEELSMSVLRLEDQDQILNLSTRNELILSLGPEPECVAVGCKIIEE